MAAIIDHNKEENEQWLIASILKGLTGSAKGSACPQILPSHSDILLNVKAGISDRAWPWDFPTDAGDAASCYLVPLASTRAHTQMAGKQYTPSLSAWNDWPLRVRKAPPARTKLCTHMLSELMYWLVISSSRRAFKIFRPSGATAQLACLPTWGTGVALPSMTHCMV